MLLPIARYPWLIFVYRLDQANIRFFTPHPDAWAPVLIVAPQRMGRRSIEKSQYPLRMIGV